MHTRFWLCITHVTGTSSSSHDAAAARGRGARSSSSPRSDHATPTRESKRRRSSTSKARVLYADDGGDELEDEEDEEEEEEEEEAGGHKGRADEVKGSSGGNSGGGEGGPMVNGAIATAEAKEPNGTARSNGAGSGAGILSDAHAGNGVSGDGGGGGVEERLVSPIIEEMLGHQGDVLERHGSRELVLRLAREQWQEPPPPVEVNLAPVADFLLGLLAAVDEEDWFAAPVMESAAPGYIAAILRPMDLGTIRARAGRRGYRSVAELRDDLVLVVANCLSYNAPDTGYAEAAVSLARLASGAYAQALAAVSATNDWGLTGGPGRPVVVVKRKRGRPRKIR